MQTLQGHLPEAQPDDREDRLSPPHHQTKDLVETWAEINERPMQANGKGKNKKESQPKKNDKEPEDPEEPPKKKQRGSLWSSCSAAP